MRGYLREMSKCTEGGLEGVRPPQERRVLGLIVPLVDFFRNFNGETFSLQGGREKHQERRVQVKTKGNERKREGE